MQGCRAVELLMTKDLGLPGVEKTAHVAALRLHKVWIRRQQLSESTFSMVDAAVACESIDSSWLKGKNM